MTAHPTAAWTLQQLREATRDERGYRFLIHDRDSIFSAELDVELTQGFGLRVLRTPPQSPQANAYCERLIGTMRRECLDFLLPLNERHLRRLLRDWVHHYNSDIILAMAKNIIHISEAEAASDFAGVLARVRAGAEIIIGDDARPVAVVRPAEPHVRWLSESLRLAKEHASTATLDEDFARDLEEVINSHRESLNPPAWD